MNTCLANPWEQVETTGPGVPLNEPQPQPNALLAAWPLVGTSGWAALDDEQFDCPLVFHPGTTSGWVRIEEPPVAQRALAELRTRTRLTWAQLARAVGVQRRSLHFWARGERPSPANFERLMGVVAVVRAIDTGDPARTTAVLLDRDRGPSPFVLLSEGRHEEVLDLLRPRRVGRVAERRRRRRPPPLSPEEQERRRGLPPLELLDARHDDVRVPEVGRLLASFPVPWSRA